MKKILFISTLLLAFACNSKVDYSPREINFDRDVCYVCRMGLTDQRYNAQAINEYGEVHWYDDLGCLVEEMDGKDWETWGGEKAQLWIGDAETGEWIDARKAWYRYGDHTPMGYGYAALKEKTADSLFDFSTTLKRIRSGISMREAFIKEKKMSMHGSKMK
jgi:nitrous oxide reductase accessory protein NosL